MITNFFKRITGLKALEDAKAKAQAEVEVSENLAKQRAEESRIAVLTPKERATERQESWVSVMDTKVNKDNPRNGFFELDWNEYFIADLIKAGYGYDNDPEEEVVDRWFRDIVKNMLSDEGQDVNRSAGFINVSKITDKLSEAK
jgi:CRISPR/Cas system Type II protein with McrA/HNH and RuvC-like nuclease domain